MKPIALSFLLFCVLGDLPGKICVLILRTIWHSVWEERHKCLLLSIISHHCRRYMGHPLTVVPYCISHFAFHTIHLLKIICAFWEGTWAFPCLWFHLTFHISHFTSHTIHLLKINCAFWEGTWAFPCLWFHLIFHISHLTFHTIHHLPFTIHYSLTFHINYQLSSPII